MDEILQHEFLTNCPKFVFPASTQHEINENQVIGDSQNSDKSNQLNNTAHKPKIIR